MPRRPTLACATCGRPMWQGTGAKADGTGRCLECRRLRPILFTHTCLKCGTTFQTRHDGRKYCGRRCSGSAWAALKSKPRAPRLSRDINYRRGRSGRPWERLKQAVYARETHCVICHRPVDMALPYRDPTTGRVNPMSKSLDHTRELDANGHPYDAHLAHFRCNSSRGARYGNRKRALQALPRTDTSHDWS